MKKIILILFIIILLGALALLVRVYLDRSNDGQDIVGEPSTEQGGLFGFLGIGGDTEIPTENDRGDFPTTGTPGQEGPNQIVSTKAHLYKLSDDPVSGATFISTSTVRYMDRGTGHVFDADLLSGEVTRVSNKTIQKAHAAFWTQEGEGVLYQQLENSTVRTTYLDITDETTISLPDNITTVAVSGDGSEVAFLVRNQLYIGDPSNIGQSTGTVPGTSWIIDWIDPETLSFTTKASALLPGFTYTTTGGVEGFTRGVGDMLGLTVNRRGSSVLYSANIEESDAILFFLDADTNTETFLNRTLAEKCSFFNTTNDYVLCAVPTTIPNVDMPDAWYQGQISFDDSLYLYHIPTETSFTYEPSEPIDAISLAATPDDSKVLFINKKDLSLWVLDLEGLGYTLQAETE